jgi:hypothetical protein
MSLPSSKKLLEKALENKHLDVNQLHTKTYELMLFYINKYYESKADARATFQTTTVKRLGQLDAVGSTPKGHPPQSSKPLPQRAKNINIEKKNDGATCLFLETLPLQLWRQQRLCLFLKQ